MEDIIRDLLKMIGVLSGVVACLFAVTVKSLFDIASLRERAAALEALLEDDDCDDEEDESWR